MTHCSISINYIPLIFLNTFWEHHVYLPMSRHYLAIHRIRQGHLKKWTGHSLLIFPNLEPLEISLSKFQHFYNYTRYDFSLNLKDVAQKLCLLCPLNVFYVFGGKSKFWAPMTLIFSAKRVFIEVNIWWKFGVDISIHFWEIQN